MSRNIITVLYFYVILIYTYEWFRKAKLAKYIIIPKYLSPQEDATSICVRMESYRI
jgi:hypothetical protein